MDELSVLEAISAAVAEETDNPPAMLTREMTAEDMPGWDSLAHVRIIYNLENRLGVRIDVVQTYDASNIGDLVDLIRARGPA